MATEKDKYDDLTLLRQSEDHYPESPDDAELETFENAYQKRNYWITYGTATRRS